MSANFKQSLERLYGLLSDGRRFGLERMQAACAAFGHPERSFKAIHVAGTNGKGSVCAFTASMLRAQGTSVGLFTSPHLNRFAERIQVDGVCVSDDELERRIAEVMDRNLDLSFFETATRRSAWSQRARIRVPRRGRWRAAGPAAGSGRRRR